ncbi:FAD-binding oxidoreductase [Methylocaldum sp.]|uniref:FAD-binding oxidoreductase n=1 Tax=Methylocaldum sp. TaxID=1969727 RepID=UPI002D31CD36|nr:FAD-binding oxidoreductase [Methylocaldum sp.]HYE34621.1 FAD-binding oxidoreductase [Methylocaldum sp.]
MPDIRYDGQTYPLCDGQSVLECLIAHGVSVPFSCRSGICQTCLMRAEVGQPPDAAQKGLKPALKDRNYFLACICNPEEDLTISLPGREVARTPATIVGMELLNAEIMHVSLQSHGQLEYRAGQFINLYQKENLARSYSLASLPGEDPHLHIHVRRVPEGRVSSWVHDGLQPGDTVDIQGPSGDCFYLPGAPEQGLLLIGTGSGLAPLYGIVRDALAQGHTGPIRLFHGSRNRNGLYLIGQLQELTRTYSNFEYTPCLSGGYVPKGFTSGRAHQVALSEVPRLAGWRVFLCGHPEMVKVAQKKAFLAGASMKDIACDAFTSNAITG